MMKTLSFWFCVLNIIRLRLFKNNPNRKVNLVLSPSRRPKAETHRSDSCSRRIFIVHYLVGGFRYMALMWFYMV